MSRFFLLTQIPQTFHNSDRICI